MQPLRVVVIDDEPSTCAFLRAVFAAEGHQCQTFLRAEEAEQYLAANEADLAMVDVYLGPRASRMRKKVLIRHPVRRWLGTIKLPQTRRF